MSNLVDTNGWHTVAAVTYDHVNAAIAQQGASPTSWAQSASDGSASVTDGTFGAWSLSTGGGSQNLMLRVPLTGGTLVVVGNSYPIPNNSVATIKVALNYLPQPQNQQKKELRVKTRQQSQDEEVATVEDLQPPLSNFLANAALKQLLQDWLNANLQSFNALFATVDLGAEFANEGLSWLRPSWHGYAVAEFAQGATLQNSIFAILCLIDEDTDTRGLADQVSPYAIPSGADAGFLISSEKFLEHMIFAAVPLMFKSISDKPASDYFTIDNNGTRIRNTRELTMSDFKLEHGKTVSDAKVKASMFTLQLDGTELAIEVTEITFEYSPGITVKLNYTGRSNLSLDAVNEILTLTATTQTGSGSVEVSKGLQIAEITLGVASIVTAMVGAFGGVVSKAATSAVSSATTAATTTAENVGEDAAQSANATVSILRGLISGTPAEITQIGARFAVVAKVAAVACFSTTLMPAITQIMQAVADGQYQKMPKITDLTSSAVGRAVVWPEGVPSFTLANAQLNGVMQFGLRATT